MSKLCWDSFIFFFYRSVFLSVRLSLTNSLFPIVGTFLLAFLVFLVLYFPVFHLVNFCLSLLSLNSSSFFLGNYFSFSFSININFSISSSSSLSKARLHCLSEDKRLRFFVGPRDRGKTDQQVNPFSEKFKPQINKKHLDLVHFRKFFRFYGN